MQLPLPDETGTDSPHEAGQEMVRDKVKERVEPTFGPAPAAREPEGAAALTADLVRRGRNPWWGRDQVPHSDMSQKAGGVPPQPEADPAWSQAAADEEDELGLDDPEAGWATHRAPFHRVESDDDNDDDDDDDDYDDEPRGFRFEWLDTDLWRDLAVFMAVFLAASAAMLYLSLRSL